MKRRGSQGFTMLETIIVVALLGIIGGLVVGNLIDLIRGAYHREMEEIAKELYVAAEHHLSVASSNHKLAELVKNAKLTENEDRNLLGAEDSEAKKKGYDGVYYYVVGDGSNDEALLSDDQSVLYAMLPPGAIDETIRSGGSYVIQYQYLDEQATLLNVFYASPTGRYGRFGHSFSASEYAGLIANYAADDKYDARANYGTDGAVIGWYDGGAGTDSANRLRPRISVENAERLTVSLDNWRNIVGLSDKYTLYLEVKGETSKASITISNPFKKMIRAVRQGENYYTYSFDLDSIADPGSHFYELKKNATVEGEFIPGENLNVKVRLARTTGATSNGGESGGDAGEGAEPDTGKTIETHSPIVKCNSLFAELVPATPAEGEGSGEGAGVPGEPTNGYIAKISNIRHLENISAEISGYADASARGLEIVGFEQTADLSWTSFRKRIKGLSDDNADTGESRKVIVYDRTSAAGAASAEGCFMPINPDGSVNYDGKGYKISDVIVSTDTDAGLFGTLPKGSTLSDMELVDFDITTASGNAGALAGVVKQGTKITGVIAHNTTAAERAGEGATDSQLQEAIIEEAKLEVRGTLAVGGLVGLLEGVGEQPSSIEKSAAAVYVKSAGTSTTTASVAGGLVGSVTGPAKIETSYAAGHTVDGLYADEDGDEAIGRYNVQAAGAAGGLVGSTTGSVTISKSYATTSVSGATAGGLAGTLSGASVDGCYATGRVKGTAAKGSFVGSTSNGTSFTLDASSKPTNYVLDIVNNLTTASSGTDDSTIPLVGTDATTTAIGKIDDTAETYDAFVKATSDAAPYDNSLPSFYGLTTVAELADLKPEDEASADGSTPAATPAPGSDDATPVAESAGDDETASDKEKGWFLFEHVGDWPLVETEVVNKKSGSGA